MKKFKVIISITVITLSSISYAEGFQSISIEKSKLLKRIQCARQSTTPAEDGLGSLWACYNQQEDVKLWINGKPSNPNQVRNIKLVVINWHGKKMDITGRIWSRIISEEYGASSAKKITTAFQKCPQKMSFSHSISILVQCTKGPKADEHMILINEF